MRMFAQALLNQNDVMQRRNNGEEKSSSKKFCAGDPYPAQRTNLKQKNEKNGADLRESVGLAKDAGRKIAEPGCHEEYQRPQVVPVDQVDHDERNENHPQQSELIGSGEDLREFHARSFAARGPEL